MAVAVHVTEKRNLKIEAMLNDLLKKSGLRSVAVGYWVGENKTDEGADLVTVARANEYGTKRIPQRSFLRSTVDENKEQIDRRIVAEMKAVVDDRKDFLAALTALGVYAVALVKRKISRSREWATPLAWSTVKRKGSTQPLVDTGQMRNKVDYRIEAI